MKGLKIQKVIKAKEGSGFLFFIIIFILSYIVIFNSPGISAGNNIETETILLDSAEKFFLSLKEGNYKTVWNLLSEKSHKTIINDVYKANKKMGVEIKKEEVIKNFNRNGMIFNNYWNAFRNNFNPDTILEHSRWEMGFIKKNKAEIVITYKKSERPARLKLFKEGGAWKVGLVETFWTRKY